MVIKVIKGLVEKRRQKKAEKAIDEGKLESYRQSEEMQKAESVKKEADRLAHLKQYKSAIEEYKRALEIFPFDEAESPFRRPAEFFFKIYYNMAASYSYLNMLNDAIKYFDRALGIEKVDDENRVKAFMGKGHAYYKAKQLVDDNFTKDDFMVVSDSEVDVKTLESLKKMDEKENLLKLARDCFAKTVELDKQNADAWYRKGHMEYLLEMVKEAMLSFDNVLLVNKNYENLEGVDLFDEIKREKGIEITSVPGSKSRFKTKTGHVVRNKAEKMIANFLFENNLMFQYDIAVSWSEHDDFRASFYIPKLDVYLEHFKHNKVSEYKKLMKWKIAQYDKAKKKLVYTTSDDEKNLEEALKLKLKPYVVL